MESVDFGALVAATESCRTARVSAWRTRGAPGRSSDALIFEGATDFARRTTAGDHIPRVTPVRRLAASLARPVSRAAATVLTPPRTPRVYAGGCVYLGVDGGARWVAHGDPDSPRQRMDPLWLLEQLPHASTDAARLTGRELAGYRTELDPSRISGSTRAQERVLAATEEIVADVWADERRRIRTMSYLVVLRGGPRTGRGALWVTTDLYDFGAPVSVAAPSPQQVAKPSEVERWY